VSRIFRLVRGGLALLDRNCGSIRRVMTRRYNFDSVSRTLPVEGVGELWLPARCPSLADYVRRP